VELHIQLLLALVELQFLAAEQQMEVMAAIAYFLLLLLMGVVAAEVMMVVADQLLEVLEVLAVVEVVVLVVLERAVLEIRPTLRQRKEIMAALGLFKEAVLE
jgi:hypothetical protein